MRTTDRRRIDHDLDRELRRSLAIERTLTSVRPVARRNLEPGVVVWAHVPFEDIDCWKLRPAVVISAHQRVVRLHPITGAISRLAHDGYLEIGDLAEAGLERACAINLRREVELDHIDIVSIAGRLSHTDRARLDIARVLVPLLTLPSLGIIRFPERGRPVGDAVTSTSESHA